MHRCVQVCSEKDGMRMDTSAIPKSSLCLIKVTAIDSISILRAAVEGADIVFSFLQ